MWNIVLTVSEQKNTEEKFDQLKGRNRGQLNSRGYKLPRYLSLDVYNFERRFLQTSRPCNKLSAFLLTYFTKNSEKKNQI